MMLLQVFLSRRVIARHNYPARMPLDVTLLVYLLVERFQPEMWAHYLAFTLVASLWISYVVRLFRDREVDVLKEE